MRGLRKTFRIPHNRVDSLKERVTQPGRHRGSRELHALRGKLEIEREVFVRDLRMANLERVPQQAMRVNDLQAELHLTLADAGQV